MAFKNKKASLELSIRAIVIVVLAMTLLGLGLGFVRNMFKDIGGLSEDISEQIRQKILDDLITNDKKVAFPKTEITIDKGGSEVLTVGIRNKGDSDFNYKISFVPISGPSTDIEHWFQYGKETYPLAAADSHVRNIRLSVPTITTSGSYFVSFNIEANNELYATKDFFVVVRE